MSSIVETWIKAEPGLYTPSQTARAVSDRSRTQRAVTRRTAPYRAGPVNRHASRHTTDRLQVLLRPLTYCHGLLRSPSFTTAYYVSHPHRDCRGKIFDSLKIWPGIHGNHGLSRLLHPVPPRCLTSPHVHPVLSTVAWNVTAVAAGNIV